MHDSAAKFCMNLLFIVLLEIAQSGARLNRHIELLPLKSPVVGSDRQWPNLIPFKIIYRDDFSIFQLQAIKNSISYLNFHLAGCLEFRQALASDVYVLTFRPVVEGCRTKLGFHGHNLTHKASHYVDLGIFFFLSFIFQHILSFVFKHLDFLLSRSFL